jgi:hypothetical protein
VRAHRLVMTVVAVMALLVLAAPTPALSSSSAAAAHDAGIGAAAFTSDNVQWLSLNPRHVGAAGGRLHEGYFYVTDPRGVYIYNVSDPSNPVLTGTLALPQGGLGAALAQEDPDTNGKILLVDAVDPNAPGNGARLIVVDVRDKANPKVIGNVAVTDHTWTCFSDCRYAIGRTGPIIDLTDPANPNNVANWNT